MITKGTRSKVKENKTKLEGLIPDPITIRKNAINKMKSICTYSLSGSKTRRDLLMKHTKERAIACQMKKGTVFVCGYVKKGKGDKNAKVVKPYCRRKPKK